MNVIVYGIRHVRTHLPLRISIGSTEGCEYCNSYSAQFEVSHYGTLYTTTDFKDAERALKENPHWFNSSLEWPEWSKDFVPSDYEIFRIGTIED